jgi:hypothetical protein
MGKRSRKRSTGPTRRPATSASTGVAERAKASWTAAGSGATDRSLAAAAHGVRPERKRTADARRQRPTPLWGPYPISEAVILIGIVLVVVGFARGASKGGIAIALGAGLCALASLEFATREHLAGYRSHALFIALVPVVVLHGIVRVIAGADTSRGAPLLIADAVLFAVLAGTLHRRYTRARGR